MVKMFGLDSGPRMNEEQLRELKRLRCLVKRGALTADQALDVWKTKFELPTSLPDLAEACRKPATHKRMRQWTAPK